MQLIVVWPCFTQSDKGVVDFDVVAYFPKEMSVDVYTYPTFIYIYIYILYYMYVLYITTYCLTSLPKIHSKKIISKTFPSILWPYGPISDLFGCSSSNFDQIVRWCGVQQLVLRMVCQEKGLVLQHAGRIHSHGNSNESEYDRIWCQEWSQWCQKNGWIFNKENVDVFFFLRAMFFFFGGGGGSLTKGCLEKTWENQKKVKEKGAATFFFVWKLVGFIVVFL